MANQLRKLDGEPYLYFREVSVKVNGKVSKQRMFYIRKTDGDGTDTNLCLKTTRVGVARKLRDQWVHARTNQKLGITAPPKKASRVKIEKVLDVYHNAGHPSIRRGRMTYPGEKHMRSENDSITSLRAGFKGNFVDELDQDSSDKYHRWRKKHATRSGAECDRSVDLDLTCLSNALNWSVRKKLIPSNPIAKRTRYYSPKKARHAKEVAPESTEELHCGAKVLLSDPRSESAGWQWLWESFSGMRTDETIKLKMIPGPGELGHVNGNTMTIRRAEKNEIGASYLHLNEGLQELRKAHAVWHEKRFPGSKWMFPGRCKRGTGTKGVQPIGATSLTTLLDRLWEREVLPRKYTSHGGRAFYVLVRRSWGIEDSQIAFELHQIGGIETLRTSYGMVPQAWREGKGPKYPWIPASGPAWADLIKKLTAPTPETNPGPERSTFGPHSACSSCNESGQVRGPAAT